MKPRPFDYARPDTVDEAVALLAEHGDDARVLAGGQSLIAMLNLRLVDPGVLIDIARIAGARRDPRSRRQDRGRRRGDAEQAAGLAGARAKSCRCWRRRCRSSATSRPATRARSAARSRTPIRARKFRCRSRCSKARWCCARAAARASLAAADFQLDMLTDRARARRTDHRGALSGRAHARRRVPRGGAPARRFRHHRGRRDDGRAQDSMRLGVGGMAGTPAVRRIAADGVGTDAIEQLAGSSKATRTCTPRRACGATSCAASRRSSSRRPRRCAA